MSAKSQARQPVKAAAGRPSASTEALPARNGRSIVIPLRVETVMDSAEQSGLLSDKTGRIGGRVSPKLIEQAKANTGISSDTQLLEFALANLALEDKFAESFRAVRGTVDPDLELGF